MGSRGRAARKKKQPLPAVGQAFRVPLGDGVHTFCWVVRPYEKSGIVIAAARWRGRGRPTPAELAAREVCDAFAWAGVTPVGPLVVVAQAAPPKSWTKLGKVASPNVDAPSLPGGVATLPDGTKRQEPTFEGFEGLRNRAVRAWRLARDGVDVTLAREAEENARIDRENEEEEAADAARRKQRRLATLTTLTRIDLLPEWDGLVPRRARATVQKLLVECVRQLRARRKADRATKLAVIEATVAKINAWNERTSLIDTPEREALCDAIDDIAHACGLRGRDLAGPYRDW